MATVTVVNVTDAPYGESQGGVIDAAGPINSALSAGFSSVYVPAGTYLLLGNLNIPSNVELYGDGAASILQLGANNIYGLSISAPPALSAAPTLVVHGTAGTSVYSYTVVARGPAGDSLQSLSVTTIAANATLNGTNYNTVSWLAVTGATSYVLVRNINGVDTIIGTTSGLTLNDQGTNQGPYFQQQAVNISIHDLRINGGGQTTNLYTGFQGNAGIRVVNAKGIRI